MKKASVAQLLSGLLTHPDISNHLYNVISEEVTEMQNRGTQERTRAFLEGPVFIEMILQDYADREELPSITSRCCDAPVDDLFHTCTECGEHVGVTRTLALVGGAK
nr:hypothetical protein [uncultured bacterium]